MKRKLTMRRTLDVHTPILHLTFQKGFPNVKFLYKEKDGKNSKLRNRLLGLVVTWWDVPLSSSHWWVLEEVLATKWARGCHNVRFLFASTFGVVLGWIVTKLKEGHLLVVCPCIPQIWKYPRHGRGEGWLLGDEVGLPLDDTGKQLLVLGDER